MIETRQQLLEHQKRRPPLAPFDAADVSPVDAGDRGEAFLGQATGFAHRDEHGGEDFLVGGLVAGHAHFLTFDIGSGHGLMAHG